MESMKCKICNNQSNKIFSKKLLTKYDVDYFKCKECNFIQTEEPYWLEEAYDSGAIASLDVGMMSRNLEMLSQTKNLIKVLFPDLKDFIALDYGGAQGIFVRMMRDLGYNYYRFDLYAENLYSRYFDIADLPKATRFNFLTAFEVFEHLPNPIEEIEKMFMYSDTLFFSTEIQPSEDNKELENWWYLVPETGQHVSLYSEDSFRKIAKIFEAHFYTNHKTLHILSKNRLLVNPFVQLDHKGKSRKTIVQKIVRRLNSLINKKDEFDSKVKEPNSLINDDFEFIIQKIRGSFSK
jgi:2-polyprenyl-3-methyl-5-hydroxy-6-metoxy-1,4-benzoquinol methylase